MREMVFWLSILVLIYTYFGYPGIISVVSLLWPKQIRKGPWQPHVSIVIAAYNEEAHIAETLRNKTALKYPKEKLEVIVVSDGSVDGTDSIVKSFEKYGVLLLRQELRSGKTAALNVALSHARGEIIVFSDANSIYCPDAVTRIVENFNDPAVGYVTGKMIYGNPSGGTVGDGCSTYMKYENFLRSAESRLGSVVGVDGGVDAVRSSLYVPMRPDQLPDLVLPLQVVEKGYRVVYEPQAVLQEECLKAASEEYSMRVRVALRSFWALWDMRHLLDLRRFGLFAWQLWSHKVVRYLGFVFLLAVYLSNLSLISEGRVYVTLFVLQNLAYLGAVSSPLLERLRRPQRILRLFHYFLLTNLAAAHAMVKFLLGQKQVVWNPRKGA